MMRLASVLAAVSALALSVPAAAQEDTDTEVTGSSGLDIGAEANLLSDYRFRGISRSDRDPAVQGALTVSTGSGLYAGARGTSLKRQENFGVAQLDLYAGYNADLGLGASLDVGMMYFLFPDGEGDTDYFEPYASVSYQLGPVQATAGAKYAWSQAALGDEDQLYLFGEAEAGIPLTPITLTAQVGHQDAGLFGDYWTWSLGARTSFGPLNAGIRYVDTDIKAVPSAEAGLVLSLSVRF
jgi:uncharacterized protein (TIGR02001 family)